MNIKRLLIICSVVIVLLGWGAGGTYAAPDKICAVPSIKYPTLASALAKRKCATINLAAGTYHENNFSLSHKVTLIGAGAATTIIDGDAQALFYLDVSGPQFTLSGITLQNAGSPYALFVESSVVNITDSVFKNNERAIWIDGGTMTILRTTFTNNLSTANGAAIFREYSPGALTIDSSKFVKNTASCGAAIYSATENAAALSITNTKISKSRGTGADCNGGAMYTTDPTQITRVKFKGNHADAANGTGGAVYQGGATLSILNSSFSKNTATKGGGVASEGGTSLTITASTFDHNTTSSSHGGGLYSTTPTTILNSTFSANTASVSGGDGGGVAFFGSGNHIVNTTFAGNIAQGGGNLALGGASADIKNSLLDAGSPNNCLVGGSVFASLGSNLSSDASCAAFVQGGDQNSTNPMLDVLKGNGGPTQTHALLAGSPALDSVVSCTDHLGAAVTTDQRGISRPQGTGCDKGAYEKTP